jgi:hypothetical protein
VIPMMEEELPAEAPRAARVARELWAITPHLFAVNAQPDLIANVGRAIAEGLRALAPPVP